MDKEDVIVVNLTRSWKKRIHVTNAGSLNKGFVVFVVFLHVAVCSCI